MDRCADTEPSNGSDLEAVEAATDYEPEVILLDFGMPNINGYDACRAIRTQPRELKSVMVALTGWGQDEDRRNSKAAGFDEHSVKPVDHSALIRILTRVAMHDRK